MKIKFNKKYALYSVGLLIAMTAIVLFFKEQDFSDFGNILFVALLYCLIQSFLTIDKKFSIIGVGLFAIGFEISKSFGWIQKLNLENSPVFEDLLGNKFDFDHLWTLMIGAGLIYLLEFYKDDTRPKKRKFFGF